MDQGEIPSPIQKMFDQPLKQCPQSVSISKNNEIFILNTQENSIDIYDIESFNHLYHLVWSSHIILNVFYLDKHDCIIFEDRNVNQPKTYYNIFFNWRVPIEKNSSTPITINLPEKILYPTSWQFTQLSNEPQILCIASISADSNPSAQVDANSIIIVTEKTCIIWDIEDRPKLRCVIILPLPVYCPIFSFYNDMLAIVCADYLFILKIIKGTPQHYTKQFTPGALCYDTKDSLNIDFGLVEAQVSNFLFITRYLMDHPVSIDIVFRLRAPSLAKDLRFLSSSSLVFLTEQASLLCSIRHRDSDSDNFDPSNLTDKFLATSSAFNSDYLVLSDSQTIQVLPNPVKSKLDISIFTFPVLTSETFSKIQFINMNQDFLIVINTERKVTTLHCYNLTKGDVISEEALKSNDIQTKILGLCLLSHKNVNYSDNCYTIGSNLLENGNQSRAFDFFISALNAKSPIYGQKRKSIIEKIISLPRRKSTLFIQQAHFNQNDINDDLLKLIKNLPIDTCIRKLLRARQYNQVLDETEPHPLTLLYKAVSETSNGNHEIAKEILSKLPLSVYENLDNDILHEISVNLSPISLIKIGRPELPNFVWPYNERALCYSYINGDVKNVVSLASEMDDAKMHLDEWPEKLMDIPWFSGTESGKVCVSAIVKYGPCSERNGKYSYLLDAVEYALKNDFRKALSFAGDKVNKILFLKFFAKTASAWATVLEQFEDDKEISELAKFSIIQFSPSQDFLNLMKNPPPIEDIDETLNVLEETDQKLLLLISPRGIIV